MQVDVQLVRQAVPSFVRESNVLDNLLEEVRQRDQTDRHTAAPTARHRPLPQARAPTSCVNQRRTRSLIDRILLFRAPGCPDSDQRRGAVCGLCAVHGGPERHPGHGRAGVPEAAGRPTLGSASRPQEEAPKYLARCVERDCRWDCVCVSSVSRLCGPDKTAAHTQPMPASVSSARPVSYNALTGRA